MGPHRQGLESRAMQPSWQTALRLALVQVNMVRKRSSNKNGQQNRRADQPNQLRNQDQRQFSVLEAPEQDRRNLDWPERREHPRVREGPKQGNALASIGHHVRQPMGKG